MRIATHSGRSIVDLARIRFGIVDELPHVCRWKTRIGEQRMRYLDQVRHTHEILRGFDVQRTGEGCLSDSVGSDVANEKRVAVRRCLRSCFERNYARRTGSIVDDHRHIP